MNSHIQHSRFWKPLWERYKKSPSIAFCRIPELELAATLPVEGKQVLDHCCGDGFFAGLCWPQATFAAGCDISPSEVKTAASSGRYKRTDTADVSESLPYDNGSFDIVFNNSALEHVLAIDDVLKEINRVLVPGGTLAFNVLNHRYFDWWPLDEASKKAYRDWQPFFHAWNLEEWTATLAKHGLEVQNVREYFDERSSQLLAECDYAFSARYFKKTSSQWTAAFGRGWGFSYWRYVTRLKNATWTADTGAGYFITAKKVSEAS